MTDRLDVRRGARRALAAAALLLAPALARAQVAQQECTKDEILAFDDARLGAWRGQTPHDVLGRYGTLITAGAYSAVLDSVAAVYLWSRSSFGEASLAALAPAQVATLKAKVDTSLAELRAGEADPAQFALGRVNVARFQVAKNPIGPPTATLFAGEPGVIVLDDAAARATVRSACWFAVAASDVLTLAAAPGRAALLKALEERTERWNNFSRNGYSMLPHELLLNGAFVGATLEPPRVQVILAHPSAGAQMTSSSFSSIEEFQRADVLALEPAGVLFYGPQHRWYAGASWVVTFPSREPAGSGVMLHLGKLGRAGYVWRGKDADGRDQSALLLSLDLYGRLTGVAEQWERLKARSVGRCLANPAQCTR